MACDDRPIVFLDCVKHTGEEEEEKSIKAGRGTAEQTARINSRDYTRRLTSDK